MKLSQYLLLSTLLISGAIQAGTHSFDRKKTIIKKTNKEIRSHDSNHFADSDDLQMTVAAALAMSKTPAPQPNVTIKDLPSEPIQHGPSYVKEYFGSNPFSSELARNTVFATLMQTMEKN